MAARAALSRRGMGVAFGGLIVLLLGAPGSPLRAQRLVFSGKGEFRDSPKPHPLKYWTTDPMQRDDGGDLCLGCEYGGRKITAADYTASVKTRRIAVIASHKILQLAYAVHGDAATEGVGSEFHWKLLLEQVGPDAYLELFHLQPTSADALTPAVIVRVGAVPVPFYVRLGWWERRRVLGGCVGA